MKTTFGIGTLCIMLIAWTQTSFGQTQPKSQKEVMREDSAAINALVMYPDTIRLDIFEVCEYPEAIASVESLQQHSRDEFVALISNYSKSEQEDFWNLSRYPGLIMQLAEGGRKSADQIDTMLDNYPADIHDTALKYGIEYYDVLKKMDDLQTRTDAQFDQILAAYPTVTQQAWAELIQYPEVINLLYDHLSLATRVGDHFKNNPQGVIRRADSLNMVETMQNNQNTEAWKDSIEENPEAEQDLDSAGDEYAAANGYTEKDIETAPDSAYVANYTCQPYPFWFGYPTWYPYSYWYPYPFWFDCGFYRNRAGRIIVIGSPSGYFTTWYFYSPEHWNRYPYLGDVYVSHYYGERRTFGGNSAIVHRWMHENRSYLPKDFASNRQDRTRVIRQLGQLNVDVRRQRTGRSASATERDKYFQENKSKYPSLTFEKRPRLAVTGPNVPVPPPEKQPHVRIGGEERGPVTRPRQPAPINNTNVSPQPRREPAVQVTKPAPQPAYRFNQLNRAQENQRNVWNQIQPATHERAIPAPKPQPAQRIQPAPRQQQPQPAVRQQQQQAPRPQPRQPQSRQPGNEGRPKR
jgi:hypothetical protein